ncbi:MAG: hypothetical protein WC480_02860 [Patescibacteria group bacterium]
MREATKYPPEVADQSNQQELDRARVETLTTEEGFLTKFRNCPRAKDLARVLILTTMIGFGGLLESRAAAAEDQAQSTEHHDVLVDENEKVFNSFGNVYEWAGKDHRANDYLPSDTNSLLERASKLQEDGISGIMPVDLEIMSKFGTFTERAAKKKIDALVEEFGGQIDNDPKLVSALRVIAEDSFVSEALTDFFRSSGRIEAWPDSGKYTPKPLKLSVGTNGDNLETQKVLYHELLHYVFDKQDTAMAEMEGRGGADHEVIRPLEDRFLITQLIDSGRMPLDRRLGALNGHSRDGRLGQKIQNMLDQKDYSALQGLVNSDYFYTTLVHNGVLSALSGNEYNSRARTIFLKLSDGSSIKFDEDYKLSMEDQVSILGGDGQPKTIIVTAKDFRMFDSNKIWATGQIPEADRSRVEGLLRELQADPDKGRAQLYSPDQVKDIAYLHAYNAAIMQGAWRLAFGYSEKIGQAVDQTFADQKYQGLFNLFIEKLADHQKKKSVEESVADAAFDIVDQLLNK